MKRKSLPTGRDFLFVEGYGNENPGAFQSTRPLRGATYAAFCQRGIGEEFKETMRYCVNREDSPVWRKELAE